MRSLQAVRHRIPHSSLVLHVLLTRFAFLVCNPHPRRPRFAYHRRCVVLLRHASLIHRFLHLSSCPCSLDPQRDPVWNSTTRIASRAHTQTQRRRMWCCGRRCTSRAASRTSATATSISPTVNKHSLARFLLLARGLSLFVEFRDDEYQGRVISSGLACSSRTLLLRLAVVDHAPPSCCAAFGAFCFLINLGQ